MERAQIEVENTVVRVLLEDVANKKENENYQRHIKRKSNQRKLSRDKSGVLTVGFQTSSH